MTTFGDFIEKTERDKQERLRLTVAKGRALGQQKQETPGKSKGGRKLGHEKQDKKKKDSLLSDDKMAAYKKQYQQLVSQGKDTSALKAKIKQEAYQAYMKRNGGIGDGVKALVGKLMSSIAGAGGEQTPRRKIETEEAAGRIAGRRKKKK